MIVQSADLALTKIANNPSLNEGDTLTYTITLTNNGPDTATGIEITDLLPTGVTYLSDTPSQGTYTSATGIWAVGGIASGASETLEITATVDAGTAGSTITNISEVTSADQDDPDSTPGNGILAEDNSEDGRVGVECRSRWLT